MEQATSSRDYEGMAKDMLARWEVKEERDDVRHDLPLIMKAMDDYNADPWHNTSYEILCSELFSPQAFPEVQHLVDLGAIIGFDLRALLMDMLNTGFGVGHAIGEGPEHIHTCRCAHVQHDEH